MQDVVMEEVPEVVVEPVLEVPVEVEEATPAASDALGLQPLEQLDAAMPAPPEPVLSAIARRLGAVAVRIALAAE